MKKIIPQAARDVLQDVANRHGLNPEDVTNKGGRKHMLARNRSGKGAGIAWLLGLPHWRGRTARPDDGLFLSRKNTQQIPQEDSTMTTGP